MRSLASSTPDSTGITVYGLAQNLGLADPLISGHSGHEAPQRRIAQERQNGSHGVVLRPAGAAL